MTNYHERGKLKYNSIENKERNKAAANKKKIAKRRAKNKAARASRKINR